MSYSYYLFIATPETPTKILKILANLNGVNSLKDPLNFNNVLISANYEDKYNSDLVESTYEIYPKINVSFRHSSVESESDQESYMFTLIAKFLQIFKGDVVLESEDPETILIRKNDDLIINKNFSNFNQLQKIFCNSTAKSFSEL